MEHVARDHTIIDFRFVIAGVNNVPIAVNVRVQLGASVVVLSVIAMMHNTGLVSSAFNQCVPILERYQMLSEELWRQTTNASNFVDEN